MTQDLHALLNMCQNYALPVIGPTFILALRDKQFNMGDQHSKWLTLMLAPQATQARQSSIGIILHMVSDWLLGQIKAQPIKI